MTDPCDCRGPIIWILPDDIVSRRSTERSSRDGDAVTEFNINPDASLLVESVRRVKASALDPRNRRLLLRPESRLPIVKGRGSGEDCGGGLVSARQSAPGSYYDGQGCYGGTLYDVYYESDGIDTVFYYVAVGSC